MEKRRIPGEARAGHRGEIRATVRVAILAFVVVLAGPHRTGEMQTSALPVEAQGYRLVFADDFDKLDLGSDGSKDHAWYPGVWFSAKELPPGNISVAGSILSLTWTRDQAGPDTSITTLSSDQKHWKAWRYGYFEARMRWDPVKGAWPAFWLIPVEDATKQNIYNGTKRSGEIDVFEGQGDHPHTFYGTIHEWTDATQDNASKNNFFDLPRDIDMTQFHTYGLLWKPGKVTWYIDNRALHSEVTSAISTVFDAQNYFLVLAMQEGVDWKGGDVSGVTASRMTLNVDWVRVWQK